MINYNLYKLFNPDLNNLNNTQLLYHWKNKGIKENRIYSLETFFKEYPTFDLILYKNNNPELKLNDNIDFMAHWHIIGKYKDNNYINKQNINKSDNLFNMTNNEYLSDNNSINCNQDNNFTDYNIIPINNPIKQHLNTYIIISNHIDEIDKNIEWIYNYGEDDWKIIIILNGIKYENNLFQSIKNKINIISINLLPMEKYDLVKYNMINLINTFYYTFNDSICHKQSKFYLPIEKKNIIEFPINNQIPIIGIYISNINIIPTKNFFIKSLSHINYHKMNIIFFKDSINILTNIFNNEIDYYILNNLDLSICDYLITNLIELDNNYAHIKYIFYPNIMPIIYLPNIIILDDEINENYFKNSLLITRFDSYQLENDILYKATNNFSNKIYVNDNLINKYKYNLISKNNFDKIHYTKYINSNYGIIKNKDQFYVKFYNKYFLTNIEYIINNLPINIDIIYIQENDNIILKNVGYVLNFKIYLIYIIDDYNHHLIPNICYYLNDNYNNYEIIIYINNIQYNNNYIENIKNLNKVKIYYNIDNIIKTKKDILLELKNNLEDNSLIITYNNYIIDQNILIENINLLFIAKKLLFSDFYKNIFIIKKEALFNENNLDYDFYLNNIKLDINNNNFKNSLLTFIHNKTNINNWLTNLKEIKNKTINIIEINSNPTKIDMDINFNYIYLNSHNLNESLKYNIAFAYNLFIHFLKKNEEEYYYIQLDYSNYEDDNIIGEIKNINVTDEDKLILFSKFSNESFKKYTIDFNIWNKIKTFIINLDNRKDRLFNAWFECNKINLLNIERFPAIHITEHNQYKLIDNNKAWKKNNIDYIKSASGCKYSHLEILKKWKEYDEEYLMILEDDIIFEEDTIYYLNLALNELVDKDWDILYLSSNLKDKEDAIKVSPFLLKIKNGLTSTAQIFKKSNLNKIIKLVEESDIEIDNTYNLLENKYSVYPMCVYQGNSYSDINKKTTDYGMFHKKFIY